MGREFSPGIDRRRPGEEAALRLSLRTRGLRSCRSIFSYSWWADWNWTEKWKSQIWVRANGAGGDLAVETEWTHPSLPKRRSAAPSFCSSSFCSVLAAWPPAAPLGSPETGTSIYALFFFFEERTCICLLCSFSSRFALGRVNMPFFS